MERVSVVINTDGRAKNLPNTVDALRRLDYAGFEICVVCGPTPDGTRELADTFAARGWAKVAHCPARNLSESRNIGIAMAAGDIVAFIDDDAICEPEWLSQLVSAYADPAVGGAGGLVMDHTGYAHQYHYASCDRLGNAILDLKEPADRDSFPYSNVFPYVQGANSSFRRETLVQIGGFDEEYEFYLDETDVCCRMVDAGHVIRQLDKAIVHHKYLASSIRTNDRITTSKYAVIKNKIYFSLVNNLRHFSMDRVVRDAQTFVDGQRRDLEYHVERGRLDADVLEDFQVELEDAWRVGLSRGLSGRRRTRPADFFAEPGGFLQCPTIAPDGPRRTFVFVSQDYAPRTESGIARYTSDIARAVAAKGHNVHVLTRAQDHNRVDLEEGVWVHRLLDKDMAPEALPSGDAIPQRTWNHAGTLLDEVERISALRRIDVIEAVSWDCEGLAMVLDGRIPVATNLITTLAHWLDTHAEFRNDRAWMAEFGEPMLAAERFLYDRSDALVAASRAIAAAIDERYGTSLTTSPRLHMCVHGLEDMRALPRRPPAALRGGADRGSVPVLFVGRLELRKGIDLLLAAATTVLRADPKVEFWIAGDDSLVLDGGLTSRQRFLAQAEPDIVPRVNFLGKVSDEELRWLYATCEVFVAPSRFESFGLIFVEAMMFAKPTVGTRVGGIVEIVTDEVTGLLVDVDDPPSLERALLRLVGDEALRRCLGERGRAEFEERFEASTVAERRISALTRIMRSPVGADRMRLSGNARELDEGRLLQPSSALDLRVDSAGDMHLTFWCHAWSGIAIIALDDRPHREVDLFHPVGRYRTIRVPVEAGQAVSIRPSGRRSPQAKDSEIIFHRAALCTRT